MKAAIPTTCKHCNTVFKSTYEYNKHRKQAHSETMRSAPASRKTLSPMETIQEAERAIVKAIQGLEVERQIHHDIVVQIDNKIAKYKKFQNGD